MLKISVIIGLIVELAILIRLFWVYLFVPDVGIQDFKILIIFLIIIQYPAHWLILKDANILIKERLRLIALTGPSILMCFFLIVTRTHHLRVISTGVIPKEIEYMDKDDKVLNGCFQQWFKDRYEKLKSEVSIYIMLLASLCILYKTRYTVYRNQAIDKCNSGCKDPPEIE